MKTYSSTPLYKGYRFPPEIISHVIWLYFRFSLSYRDGEEIMAQRGIVLTYETVRQWCQKFGQTAANELKNDALNQETNGISTKCFSSSTDRSVICGERLTNMAPFWTSWCRADATNTLPNSSSGNCSKGWNMCHASLSRTS